MIFFENLKKIKVPIKNLKKFKILTLKKYLTFKTLKSLKNLKVKK